MKEITKTEVVDFYRHMTVRFGTKIIDKQSSIIMKIIGCIFQLFRVMTYEEFMNNFITTLGKRIYVPFTVGKKCQFSLWEQIKVCLHEHEHVSQSNKDWLYPVKYLLSSRYRMICEAEAYSTAMEIDWWYCKGGSTQVYTKLLKKYLLTEKLIAEAEKIMLARWEAAKRGEISRGAMQIALTWLEDHDDFRIV